MLPIAVDAMGGDNAPKEIVAGARQAAEELDVPVVLVGQPEAIGDTGGLDVIAASEVIGMRDDPAQGVRRKKDSSLVRAAEAVRDGTASAMVSEAVDVVVTDGFTGNVALKTLEGGLKFLVKAVIDALNSSEEAKSVSGVLLDALAPVAAELDPDTTGGAMLLGVEGVCIISHGSSSARAIVNAVRVAGEMVDGQLVDRLRGALAAA